MAGAPGEARARPVHSIYSNKSFQLKKSNLPGVPAEIGVRGGGGGPPFLGLPSSSRPLFSSVKKAFALSWERVNSCTSFSVTPAGRAALIRFFSRTEN